MVEFGGNHPIGRVGKIEKYYEVNRHNENATQDQSEPSIQIS